MSGQALFIKPDVSSVCKATVKCLTPVCMVCLTAHEHEQGMPAQEYAWLDESMQFCCGPVHYQLSYKEGKMQQGAASRGVQVCPCTLTPCCMLSVQGSHHHHCCLLQLAKLPLELQRYLAV